MVLRSKLVKLLVFQNQQVASKQLIHFGGQCEFVRATGSLFSDGVFT